MKLLKKLDVLQPNLLFGSSRQMALQCNGNKNVIEAF